MMFLFDISKSTRKFFPSKKKWYSIHKPQKRTNRRTGLNSPDPKWTTCTNWPHFGIPFPPQSGRFKAARCAGEVAAPSIFKSELLVSGRVYIFSEYVGKSWIYLCCFWRKMNIWGLKKIDTLYIIVVFDLERFIRDILTCIQNSISMISINYQSQPFYLSFQDLSEPPGILAGKLLRVFGRDSCGNPKPREKLIPPNGWSAGLGMYMLYIYIYIYIYYEFTYIYIYNL